MESSQFEYSNHLFCPNVSLECTVSPLRMSLARNEDSVS